MVRIKVRVFTFSIDPTVEHSFVVGSTLSGLSPSIGMIVLEENEEMTFETIRHRIELQEENGLIRRSLMFQEALFQMTAARNPHKWPQHTLQTYWLGYFADENDLTPTIIQMDQEKQLIHTVLDMKSTKVTADLIMIPQSQIGPVCNKCCRGCPQCPPMLESTLQ